MDMAQVISVMTVTGTLHLADGSVPLVPHALDQAKELARHPWEKKAIQILASWWDSEESMEMSTSGSTGTPRWIQHPKAAIAASAMRTLAHFQLEPGASAALAMPGEFVGGMMMLIRAVLGGLELYVLEPKLAPQFPPTHFDFVALTPAQARALCRDELQVQRMAGWKTLLLGGAPLLADWMNDLPAGLEVFESFGMTETISHFAVRQWSPVQEEAFRCLPGIAVAATSNGALQVHLPELPALQSNDAVEIIDSRTFRWLGRLDDVINSGGVKVHPHAISTLLSPAIPGPFVVFGRPHDKLGEEVVLRIHANEEPANADALRSSLQRLVLESLPRYHAPKTIEWKPLEKTESGKWKSPQ
jgi:o-succinylbenzoate---CoA ligase